MIIKAGQRPAELPDLDWHSVFPDKNFLKVEKGKTRTARCRVWLPERARKILYHRRQKFDGDYLFPQDDKDGKKTTSDPGTLHLPTITALGFIFVWMTGRQTPPKRALESGCDLLTRAAIPGHTNLRTVMRSAHPSEDHRYS